MLFAILSACTIPIDTSVNEDVGTSVQFNDECQASQTFEDDRGSGVYTLAPVDGGCQLDVTWTGEVIDQEALDAELEGELAGRARDRLSIQQATVTLSDIGLADNSGAPVNVAVFPSYDIDLDLAGSDFYSDSGVAASALLGAPVAIELTTPQLEALTASIQGEDSVDGALAATVVVSDQDLATLAGLGETQLSLNLDIDLQLGISVP